MAIEDHYSGVHLDPTNLKFTLFTGDEIEKLSVCKVITPLTFDSIGSPLPGGLYDRLMGPVLRNDLCSTCTRDIVKCRGHMGHISLCVPVYNPFIFKAVYNILRMSCLKCYKLQIPDLAKYIIELQINLIDAGYIVEAQEIDIYKSEIFNNTSAEVAVDDKSGLNLNTKIFEYQKLLTKDLVTNNVDTRNNEALRQSIINITIQSSITKRCIHCKESGPKIRFSAGKLLFTINKSNLSTYLDNTEIDHSKFANMKTTNRIIQADECKTYLTKIYQNDSKILKILYPLLNCCNADIATDIFFMNTLPVVPPIVRPINLRQGGVYDHQQTKLYKNILFANSAVRAVMAKMKYESLDSADILKENMLDDSKAVYDSVVGRTIHEKLYNAWNSLQEMVNSTVQGTEKVGNMRISLGLKDLVEKKEGLIRMHLMGKRVNYAARTVITPDPNISVDEIGVPEEFALKLTYPVPVTKWNVAELRKLVINGPKKHPGACFVENSHGLVKLLPDNLTQRTQVSKTLLTPGENNMDHIKVVHRHLINHDVLLLNRQPSLHRPSIMAHKARILKEEKTFRLHYSNCKSYNADFDGDEMNGHFPQNEVGRSEAYNLVNVSNHYLVPKDGTPLGGLIQDHVISGVRIQMRGRFFNRHDYQQLVYQGLSHMPGEIIYLPPSIIKPKMLWSGKQIISTIIINLIPKKLPKINLKSNSKINNKAWQVSESRPWNYGGSSFIDNELSEAEVIIRNGELLSGILDKNHYGATPYSLIHCMYELYGGECSTALLTSLARLFTIYLQWEGFTLGVNDILVLQDADKIRTNIIKECRNAGISTALSALDLPETTNFEELKEKMAEAYVGNPKFRTVIDRKFKSVLDIFTNRINKTCLPMGLITKFPANNLQLMVQSGAKGSTVNTMQISCLLGQIELEGKRPPLMISDRTLPCFASFETSPKSGGFIDGRFMTGIQPEDFFFHCMAGREGLIDTAVKTSRSGYLQRCLIKHLEGLNVQYDMTVRDSDKCVIQFLYGEDGMDICKSQFLRQSQMEFLDMNDQCIVTDSLLECLKNQPTDNKKMNSYTKRLKSWRKANENPQNNHSSAFIQFANDQGEVSTLTKKPNKLSKKTGRTRGANALQKLWMKADEETRSQYKKKFKKQCPDPLVSKFKPDQYLGSITEYLESLIKNYVKFTPERKTEITNLVNVKYMNSLAAPGEPVGLLAAQSIGEPSTQMTLNTFHFAGRGDMNVTLGIPRLREILMMASTNIKTPSMEIPFIKNEINFQNLPRKAEKLRLEMNRVTLHDVLESIHIKAQLLFSPDRTNEYELIFNFLPPVAYQNSFRIKPKEILKYMSKKFFGILIKFITGYVKNKKMLVDVEPESTEKTDNDENLDNAEPQKMNIKNEEDSSEEEEENDADESDNKKKKKQSDENNYDGSDNDEQNNEVFNSDSENENALDNSPNENLNNQGAGKIKQEEFSNFDCDDINYRWCKLVFQLPIKYPFIDLSQILKELAKKAVIYEIPRINRAITFTQNNQLILKTEGVNLQAIFKYDKLLDLNKIYSNDIHAIAQTYGIEAAARILVKEVQNVFGVYGITVDTRHLLLIANYMTFEGKYSPLSRRGLATSTSPLQQMSFETSLQFLRNAIFTSASDELESPSSCLMVGQPCKSGTGASFDLLSVLDNNNQNF